MRFWKSLNILSVFRKVPILFFTFHFFAILICGGLCARIFSILAAPLSPSAISIKTGPAVGQPIPDFRLSDQLGRKQTFETVKGPKGAFLVFYRSADW
jgi:hypothetical protein